MPYLSRDAEVTTVGDAGMRAASFPRYWRVFPCRRDRSCARGLEPRRVYVATTSRGGVTPSARSARVGAAFAFLLSLPDYPLEPGVVRAPTDVRRDDSVAGGVCAPPRTPELLGRSSPIRAPWIDSRSAIDTGES